MSIIRKLSVGTDFPNGVMHYQTGKRFEVLGEMCEVTHIIPEMVEGNKLSYNIYVRGENSSFLWKSVVDMPVHIEYDITFQ